MLKSFGSSFLFQTINKSCLLTLTRVIGIQTQEQQKRPIEKRKRDGNTK